MDVEICLVHDVMRSLILYFGFNYYSRLLHMIYPIKFMAVLIIQF